MSAPTGTKSSLDNEMISRYSSASWDDIPTEIFIYIFKKLNITSLRCCFAVNKKWRDITTCICDKQDLWQALAEDGMVNHGVTQQFKSTLSWKDLYFNSFLWTKLPSAEALKLHEVELSDIRNLRVYRDKLLVVHPYGVECYDIKSFQAIRSILTLNCVDVQESDNILMVVTENNYDTHYRVTVFIKLDKDEEINIEIFHMPLRMPRDGSIHAFVESLHWRLIGNRVYVIDKKCVLWKCSAINRVLSVKALAKYYGEIPRTRSSTIHVIKEDVYISLKWGHLVKVTKNTRMFQKVNTIEIPTRNIENSTLNTKAPRREGFNTFNAFIKFPFAVEFIDRSVAPLNMIHYHYNDSKMTCALQHGDVVIRGFVDGEVTINLLRDDCKYNLNVHQFGQDEVKEPAVIALDICELKGMHKLFVATKHKLYNVLLKCPNDRRKT
ncbi:uncharacterized protein LOC133519748 [Cydia pomonella]|uniref:uncharacterized protein LOC133519748 n=1 Tax=Cydia pomonella TaxID=82600 RepID=UPI002ADE2EDA|nr:uncharacterized protein LOC133519748 [Cydia pomonella]